MRPIIALAASMFALASAAEVPNWARAKAKPSTGRSAKSVKPRRVVVDPGDHRVIPEVLDGDGFKTRIFLTNLDVKNVNYELNFFDEEGNDLELAFDELGFGNIVSGTIRPRSSIIIQTSGASTGIVTGYALLFTLDRPGEDPGSAITHDRIGAVTTLRFESEDGSPEASYPQISESESEVTFPFDAGAANTTLISLVNSFQRDVKLVEFIFRGLDGEELLREQITALAYNKYLFTLEEDFPQIQDRIGTLTVRASSPLLSTVAFRIGENGFTPVLPVSIAPNVNPAAPTGTVSVANLPGVAEGCRDLFGGLAFSSDGKYLGRVTTSQYALDSMSNRYGPFGSPNEPMSMWNERGSFGSTAGDLSATSPNATRPPILYIDGTPAAVISGNSSLTARVTLQRIADCIKRQ